MSVGGRARLMRLPSPPDRVAEGQSGDDDQHEALTNLLNGTEDVTAHATECAAGDHGHDGGTDGYRQRKWDHPPAHGKRPQG